MTSSATLVSRLRDSDIPWATLAQVAFAGCLILYWLDITQQTLRVLAFLYVLIIVFIYFEELLKLFQDRQEPPLIPHHGLPFLGHTIGMFWYGAKYFDIVNRKTNHPIYSLQTLNARTVIVTSPQLAAPIQRASKNTSFYQMIMEVTRRLIDLDAPTMEVIAWNLDGEFGSDEGLMTESSHMVHRELSPGPILNSLSTIQLDKFAELLHHLVPGSGVLHIGLMVFVKQIFTVANAFTIYGPQNPFAIHPELVEKFWEYEAGMVGIMADLFPTITARKSYYARQAINNALHEFINREYYKTASPIIQKHVAISIKHGLTAKMAGHSELIFLFGVLGNAVPTTFWFLVNIISRPELLVRIREETSVAISSNINAKNPAKAVNVTKLKTACPLLVSTYRESLRTIANLASVRLVTNTHTISAPGHRPYVLKKSSIIQIASGVIHSSPAVWGRAAGDFVPTRFISNRTNTEQDLFPDQHDPAMDTPDAERSATQLPRNVPSAAYRAFGGGSVICPGRHFAQSEILGFVTLCLHMFEFLGEDGGPVILPKKDDTRIPLSVMKPDRDPGVRIQRREGEGKTIWSLEL